MGFSTNYTNIDNAIFIPAAQGRLSLKNRAIVLCDHVFGDD